jgi:hypothetical protein
MRTRWRRGIWFLPTVIIGLSRHSPREGLLIVAAGAGTGLVMLGFSNQLRLALVDGTIRRRGWLWRTVTLPTAAVASVVELHAFISRMGPPEKWLLFLGPDGRTLLRAYIASYPPEEVDRFRAALGVPWTETGLTTVHEARSAFPGSFRWPWAHYWLSTLGGTVLAFVLLVIGVAIYQSVS